MYIRTNITNTLMEMLCSKMTIVSILILEFTIMLLSNIVASHHVLLLSDICSSKFLILFLMWLSLALRYSQRSFFSKNEGS